MMQSEHYKSEIEYQEIKKELVAEIDEQRTKINALIEKIDVELEKDVPDYIKLLMIKVQQYQVLSNQYFKERQVGVFLAIEKSQIEIINMLYKFREMFEATSETKKVVVEAKEMFDKLEKTKKQYVYNTKEI
ncbi:MAG: hypothetical protein EOL97_09445 [Spirochaetia bacterium]|nr:hypothetical protein [Spirochaetia bacterium]